MAKNRLFGWMFVEDSNKEPKPTVEPVKQEISVVVPTPTPPIVAAGDVDTKLVELLERKINEANLPVLIIWSFFSQQSRCGNTFQTRLLVLRQPLALFKVWILE